MVRFQAVPPVVRSLLTDVSVAQILTENDNARSNWSGSAHADVVQEAEQPTPSLFTLFQAGTGGAGSSPAVGTKPKGEQNVQERRVFMETKMCPFCGSGEIYLRSSGTRYGVLAFVECGVCGAKTKAYKKGNVDPESEGFFTDSASILAKTAWNRRVKGD